MPLIVIASLTRTGSALELRKTVSLPEPWKKRFIIVETVRRLDVLCQRGAIRCFHFATLALLLDTRRTQYVEPKQQ